MEHYQQTGNENPSPAQIDEYGGGLYRLRHVKSAYQGRGIFFVVNRKLSIERLILLVVYKKEGQKTPQRVLNLALRRKKQWEKMNEQENMD
jgi:phage-related protein